jgi:anti-sigma factor RsiW
MAKRTHRLTDGERDQRRARDRERLQQACEQLLSSEGWQRWVRARARNGLARYSVPNLCLILLANPRARFVAGFKAWLERGNCVRKGEHAIWKRPQGRRVSASTGSRPTKATSSAVSHIP